MKNAGDRRMSEEKEQEHVWLIVAFSDKDESNPRVEGHENVNSWVYGVYDSAKKAYKEVHEIYDEEILGTKYGTDYLVLKKKVN